MNFPGENAISLTDSALIEMVEEALNHSRAPSRPSVRVVSMERHAYKSETNFTVTSDPLPVEVEPPEFHEDPVRSELL